MAVDQDRPRQLIESLDLQPHPEGGYFAEIFRSLQRVSALDSAGSAGSGLSGGSAGNSFERSAVSTIYFLLTHPEFSCWHIVEWDEIWHFYEGHPLELLTIDPQLMVLHRRVLGLLDTDQRPVLTVPAGHWQAARPIDGYTLAGCTVGPGFEFSDMALLREDATAAGAIRRTFPEVAGLL
ncbi:MAG: cupin domain-containing protein [Rhodothermia bacterium]